MPNKRSAHSKYARYDKKIHSPTHFSGTSQRQAGSVLSIEDCKDATSFIESKHCSWLVAFFITVLKIICEASEPNDYIELTIAVAEHIIIDNAIESRTLMFSRTASVAPPEKIAQRGEVPALMRTLMTFASGRKLVESGRCFT